MRHHKIFCCRLQASTTPWLLVVGKEPFLTANLVIRGSFPVNVVHLVTTKMGSTELNDYSNSVNRF